MDHVDDRYATADWNGDLHVVDPASGAVVDIPGPSSFATDVVFAGRDRLVSRHSDGSTYLWDIPTRGVVGRLWESGAFEFWAMAVERTADTLLQATPVGLARIPLDPDEWFRTVCARVARELTDREFDSVTPDLDPGPGCDRVAAT